MYPVLFRLGFLTAPSYTALLDIGLVSGAVIECETLTVAGWRADQVANLVLSPTGAALLTAGLFRKIRNQERRR